MDLSDIQGLVFYGYGKQPLARYYLLTFGAGSDAHGWLSRLIQSVSSAARGERRETTRLNVALSASGLAKLGLQGDALLTFPREFMQGMGHPERSIVLGDFGDSAPEHWQYGNEARPIDALLMLFCRSERERDARHAELVAELERYGIESRVQDAYRPADGREHFGFADGLTNPIVRRGPVKRQKNRFDPPIKAGELLLGYRNGYGRLAHGPRAPVKRSTRELPPLCDGGRTVDLGHNGTYLVLRKLEQDVERFWGFAAEQAQQLGSHDTERWTQLFAARLVGRWPNGTPLALEPLESRPTDELHRFGYQGDPRGLECPLGAHVRRANPRDALGEDAAISLERVGRHRIMRRGRLYLEKEGGVVKKGIVFMALGANLRRQFEFVQQSWLNGPKPLRERCVGLPNFVRVRGGGYFFLPSLRALSYLAEG